MTFNNTLISDIKGSRNMTSPMHEIGNIRILTRNENGEYSDNGMNDEFGHSDRDRMKV